MLVPRIDDPKRREALKAMRARPQDWGGKREARPSDEQPVKADKRAGARKQK